MRQGSHSKRHRGRSNGRRSHGLASSYESNGPDVKIKGSAAQLQERYENLAREAVVSGDRVAAESYLQHAEHYQRIINAHQAAQAEANGARQQRGRDNRDGNNKPEAEATDGAPAAEANADAPASEGKAEGKSEGKSERGGRRRGRGRQPANAQPRDNEDPNPPESAAV